jgi:hypothetical protein
LRVALFFCSALSNTLVDALQALLCPLSTLGVVEQRLLTTQFIKHTPALSTRFFKARGHSEALVTGSNCRIVFSLGRSPLLDHALAVLFTRQPRL